MGTKTYNNYEDLITFSRASAGYALRPVSYGSELVDSFDSTSFPYETFTSSGNTITSAINTTSFGIASVDIAFETGKLYLVSGSVTLNSGTGPDVRLGINDSLGQTTLSVNTSGSFSKTFVASNETHIGFRNASGEATNFSATLSVKEVTFDESDGTLTLFEHPDNIPRVEYDADGNRLGLLVEEARTNLIANSDFDAGVSTSAATITADTVTSPDGTQNAATLELTGNTSGFAYYTVTVTASTKYTWSWFAKAGTATAHVYAVYDNSNAAFVSRQEYTLTNGENYGNGWYRHQVAFTTPAGCTSVRVYPQRNTDAGGAVAGTQGTMFVWGGQLEADAFASSIIRTTGSTATRAVDNVEINTNAFGFNDKKGTMVVEFDQTYAEGGSGFPRVVELGNDATAVQRCNIYIGESADRLTAALNTNNANQGLLNLRSSLTGTLPMTKVAFGFADDNLGASDDGDTALTDTSADFSGATNKRNRIFFGISTFVGHIKSFKYYPRRLTNAQLEDLSQ